MKFGQLILRKIITTVATRCQILKLKCPKIASGWGSAPDPAREAYAPSWNKWDLRLREGKRCRERNGRREGDGKGLQETLCIFKFSLE